MNGCCAMDKGTRRRSARAAARRLRSLARTSLLHALRPDASKGDATGLQESKLRRRPFRQIRQPHGGGPPAGFTFAEDGCWSGRQARGVNFLPDTEYALPDRHTQTLSAHTAGSVGHKGQQCTHVLRSEIDRDARRPARHASTRRALPLVPERPLSTVAG